MKIGILLPSSRLYPAMMFDFMEAFQLYFKSKDRREISFIIEMVGTGGDYKLLQQKAQILLMNSEVKIILAFLDLYACKQFEPFVNAAGKLLISCEPGASIPGVAVPSPNHLAFSLQSAYGATLNVRQALKNNHIKNFYITSFFDGGYNHCYAAARTWERAGGALLANFVTPFSNEELQIEILEQKINELQPDCLILQNCAEAGGYFLEKCKEVNIPKTIPIYSSPFMLEESWIEVQEFYFENMQGYVAWHSDIATDENVNFRNVILNEVGKKANVFHLLGWESAMLIESASKLLAEKPMPAMQLVKQLTEQNFESPRGKFQWQGEHRHFVLPMYEVKLVNENNQYKTKLTGQQSNDMATWAEFASDVPSGVISRWYNMYLCPT